ncbi:uncharacterized protein LOC133800460 isoform X2 [Humulus lupulus]|uniref:uncharacterized protein LOC133800460 isoform X2 n=1 Tax=Humulus lupulus TaxID=3486 RepID=UPI002B4028A3|nr:uncharacterized protein LOC133800460 isoform X2 [Humulus lupulus]
MDFHSLNRKELQALCKKNKIPANQTNLAMADALQALPLVEGLEEFLNQPKSDDAQLDDESVLGSPDPRTSCRTSTRRKPVMVEPKSLQPMTRTQRGTAARGGVAEEPERNDVPITTPAARSTRRRAPSSSVKDEISVQTAAYSTRRSVRVLEKTMQNLSIASNRKAKEDKVFSEEMTEAAEEMDAEIEMEVSEKTQDLNVSTELMEETNEDSLVETKAVALVKQSDETMDVEDETKDKKEVIDVLLANDSFEAEDSHEDSFEANDAPLAEDSFEAQDSPEDNANQDSVEANDVPLAEDSSEAQDSLHKESNANNDLASDSLDAEISEVEPHTALTLSLAAGHSAIPASNGSEMHKGDDFDGKFDFELDSESDSKEASRDVESEDEENFRDVESEDEENFSDDSTEEEESDDEITDAQLSEEETDSKVSLTIPSSMVSATKMSGQFPRPTISTTPRKSSSKKQTVIQLILDENIEEDSSRVCENEVKTNENATNDQKKMVYEGKSLRQLQKILRDKLKNQNNKQVENTTRVALQALPENHMPVDEAQKGF